MGYQSGTYEPVETCTIEMVFVPDEDKYIAEGADDPSGGLTSGDGELNAINDEGTDWTTFIQPPGMGEGGVIPVIGTPISIPRDSDIHEPPDVPLPAAMWLMLIAMGSYFGAKRLSRGGRKT